jgi:hypothetical protein
MICTECKRTVVGSETCPLCNAETTEATSPRSVLAAEDDMSIMHVLRTLQRPHGMRDAAYPLQSRASLAQAGIGLVSDVQRTLPHTRSFRLKAPIPHRSGAGVPYPMGCQDKARIAAEASAVAARMDICAGCEHNADGVCQLLKSACPAKDAVIAVGCEIAQSYCPDGKWDRLPIRQPCSLCGAVHRSADGICTKCKKNR